MAEQTAISWTDATFNPWWGCQKVSPACDNCYAERDAGRFAPGAVLWGVGSERRTFEDKHWQAPLRWAKTMPAKLGRRPRVFCASMGDWLDLDAPLDEFVRLLDTIKLTPELDWLLLSKRIGNWRKRLDEAREWLHFAPLPRMNPELSRWILAWLDGTPPANVWVGATVVDQDEFDRDVDKLLRVPGRVRFVSIEPMLGPIELGLRCENWPEDNVMDPETGAYSCCRLCDHTGIGNALDWVIAGGESGPKARPMHPDWVRALRDECQDAGVPFHFKQWGEWLAADGPRVGAAFGAIDRGDRAHWRWLDRDGAVVKRSEEANRNRSVYGSYLVAKVGKAAAGRLLDGVTHDEFPEVQR